MRSEGKRATAIRTYTNTHTHSQNEQNGPKGQEKKVQTALFETPINHAVLVIKQGTGDLEWGRQKPDKKLHPLPLLG